jgi:hypothetical protein
MVLLYILTIVYVPYQSIEAALKRPEANVLVSPTPHSNQDLVALAWGFIWRFTAVSIAFALPLKMTGYDPDEIEGLIVSSILMLAVCWVAAMWLVFSPQGKSRFQATLSEPVANNSD